jgi:hypothetical protein
MNRRRIMVNRRAKTLKKQISIGKQQAKNSLGKLKMYQTLEGKVSLGCVSNLPLRSKVRAS